MAVIGRAPRKAPVLVVRPLVNQTILGLWGTETMEIKFLKIVHALELVSWFRLVVAAVKEPFAVFGPGGAGKFHPFEGVAHILGSEDVPHLPFLPVGTSRSNSIGHQLAIVRHRVTAQGCSPIAGEFVGIKQDPWRSLKRNGRVQNALVLQAVVLGEEKNSSFLE